MRAYFSQFGDITRLRLSRNQKTGHSKHYAFVEFASTEVAKIVAATMNKYLLFGHILQIRMLAPEEVHKDLFKNANKRFKVVPRNKISGRRLRLPMERDHWEKRIEEETKRRKAKEEKLMALGYDFKMPGLKTTKSIPFRSSATKQLEAASVDMEEMLKELPEVPDVDVERDMSLPSTSTKGTPKEPGSKPAKVKKGKVKSVKSKASA